MMNRYENQYNEASNAMMKAWDTAVQAVKGAGHFTAVAEDGIPAWTECFFGETRKAYEEAAAKYREIRDLYLAEEAALKKQAKAAWEAAHPEEAALKKQAKAAWEAAHPEEAEAKKRQASLTRYRRLAAQKKAAILKLQEELKELEGKMKALEG